MNSPYIPERKSIRRYRFPKNGFITCSSTPLFQHYGSPKKPMFATVKTGDAITKRPRDKYKNNTDKCSDFITIDCNPAKLPNNHQATQYVCQSNLIYPKVSENIPTYRKPVTAQKIIPSVHAKDKLLKGTYEPHFKKIHKKSENITGINCSESRTIEKPGNSKTLVISFDGLEDIKPIIGSHAAFQSPRSELSSTEHTNKSSPIVNNPPDLVKVKDEYSPKSCSGIPCAQEESTMRTPTKVSANELLKCFLGNTPPPSLVSIPKYDPAPNNSFLNTIPNHKEATCSSSKCIDLIPKVVLNRLPLDADKACSLTPAQRPRTFLQTCKKKMDSVHSVKRKVLSNEDIGSSPKSTASSYDSDETIIFEESPPNLNQFCASADNVSYCDNQFHGEASDHSFYKDKFAHNLNKFKSELRAKYPKEADNVITNNVTDCPQVTTGNHNLEISQNLENVPYSSTQNNSDIQMLPLKPDLSPIACNYTKLSSKVECKLRASEPDSESRYESESRVILRPLSNDLLRDVETSPASERAVDKRYIHEDKLNPISEMKIKVECGDDSQENSALVLPDKNMVSDLVIGDPALSEALDSYEKNVNLVIKTLQNVFDKKRKDFLTDTFSLTSFIIDIKDKSEDTIISQEKLKFQLKRKAPPLSQAKPVSEFSINIQTNSNKVNQALINVPEGNEILVSKNYSIHEVKESFDNEHSCVSEESDINDNLNRRWKLNAKNIGNILEKTRPKVKKPVGNWWDRFLNFDIANQSSAKSHQIEAYKETVSCHKKKNEVNSDDVLSTSEPGIKNKKNKRKMNFENKKRHKKMKKNLKIKSPPESCSEIMVSNSYEFLGFSGFCKELSSKKKTLLDYYSYGIPNSDDSKHLLSAKQRCEGEPNILCKKQKCYENMDEVLCYKKNNIKKATKKKKNHMHSDDGSQEKSQSTKKNYGDEFENYELNKKFSKQGIYKRAELNKDEVSSRRQHGTGLGHDHMVEPSNRQGNCGKNADYRKYMNRTRLPISNTYLEGTSRNLSNLGNVGNHNTYLSSENVFSMQNSYPSKLQPASDNCWKHRGGSNSQYIGNTAIISQQIYKAHLFRPNSAKNYMKFRSRKSHYENRNNAPTYNSQPSRYKQLNSPYMIRRNHGRQYYNIENRHNKPIIRPAQKISAYKKFYKNSFPVNMHDLQQQNFYTHFA